MRDNVGKTVQTVGPKPFTNRLIHETSPYLLQHAHNPVDWYPWCDEAFERATREDRPVFLSVGYSTCHWCHVMERESFEDEEIAKILNDHFIAIKVDREERPDIDELYMKAAMLFTGGGGWPMTVVMTPDRRPFFAGTYFPARDFDRGPHTGLLTILSALKEVYSEDKARALASAAHVTERIRMMSEADRPGPIPGDEAIARAVTQLRGQFDPVCGGFLPAPKFPMPSTLKLLMRHHHRTKDARPLKMVETTLEKMAAGGICDQVGGGFHRYSTDEYWLVPHFEKMLYDNAQLASVYLEAFQIAAREDFARIARETLDYLMREMSHPEGGLFSATDADSALSDITMKEGGESEEGIFFTWTPDELSGVLGKERAALAADYFGATAQGNFEGRNILFTPFTLSEFASVARKSPEEVVRELSAIKADLYRARIERPKPFLDDKIIAAWNGLAISAFASGARILKDERYLLQAGRAAGFILSKMMKDGRLYRTYRNGACRNEGTLSDYAFVIKGLLDLFESAHDLRRLDDALRLQRILERDFGNREQGGFYMTASGSESLLTRAVPIGDGAEPSGNSAAISNLVRLASLTGDEHYRKSAEQSLSAFSATLERGAFAADMLCALDAYHHPPLEIAIVESRPGAASSFERALHEVHVPNRVVVVATEGDDLAAKAEKIPWLRGRGALGAKAAAYVCRQGECKLPTTDPDALKALLLS